MKKKGASTAILLAGLLLFGHSVEAVEPVGENSPAHEEKAGDEREAGVGRRFLKDGGAVLTSPLRWRLGEWLLFGGVSAATWVMINNDERMYADIKKFQARNLTIDDVSPFFSGMCEGYPFGVAGLYLAHGLIFRDARSRETGLQGLQAMIYSFFITQLVKHLTGRVRPSIDGSDYWYGPKSFFDRYREGSGGFARYDAFFSGHTVTVWSLATVIGHNYGGPVAWLAYGLATLGGLATITEDLHWVSDVFLGAVVGYAIGRFVARRHRGRWQVAPLAMRGGFGLSIGFNLGK